MIWLFHLCPHLSRNENYSNGSDTSVAEWIEYMERLVKQNYFDNQRKECDHREGRVFEDWDCEATCSIEEFGFSRDAVKEESFP